MDTSELIRTSSSIRPRRAEMIAAWPGVGNVALILTQYLISKLKAYEFAEIEPTAFFNATGVLVRDNVIEEPQFPKSKFYYWRNPDRPKDLIFFVGEEQPSWGSYEMSHAIVDVARKYRVKRLYTFAAALVKIHHSEAPRVWAAATEERLLKEITKYDVILRGAVQIAGLNGLVLGVAKERGLPGICLLGETPMYATRIPNPKASLAITSILAEMLGLTVDLTELREIANKGESEMGRIATEAMTQFIDNFTTPIWESGEEHQLPEE